MRLRNSCPCFCQQCLETLKKKFKKKTCFLIFAPCQNVSDIATNAGEACSRQKNMSRIASNASERVQTRSTSTDKRSIESKYYLYVSPPNHNCKGSRLCTQWVKNHSLDTLYVVSESGHAYMPIVKIINVAMLDLDKCPSWLIGTPTLYETSTRSVYKGQNAFAKIQGISESPTRKFWISQSEAESLTGEGMRTPTSVRTGAAIRYSSSMSTTSKGQRGTQHTQPRANVPRGSQGSQGMGGSNALRGAWNAQQRMGADALSQSMSKNARGRFGGDGDGRTLGSDSKFSGRTMDGSRLPFGQTKQQPPPPKEPGFMMSTLLSAGDSNATSAGNFALDPSDYDTPEARQAKIITKKSSTSGSGKSAPAHAAAPPDGDFSTTSPVDLATAFKRRQAAHPPQK